jgi:putative cell wall-binding protein
MKKKFNKKLVWLLVLTLLLCIIPAAYVLAKTVAAQEAETVFFYVTNADGKEILVRAAPIDEIRKLSHQKSEGENYAISSLDSLPTTCYAEAQGFTTDELIQYLNQYIKKSGSEMGTLTYEGKDRMYFMADDSFGRWTRNYTAEKLNGVERKYTEGLYPGWQLFDAETWLEDFDLEHEETVEYKEQAWAEGEVMPAILSTLSNSGRTTTNVSETSDGILDYVLANGGKAKGCLKNVLDTDKALTLYIPTSEDQFMKGMRTCSENFKWIYAIRLKMATLPQFESKGTVPAAVPSYGMKEVGGKTLLTVTLTSPMKEATIYYNDGTNPSENSAQTKYKDPFTIDVTGRDLSTNPIKYYTRTVREGYDDKGPLTMQYYQVAPAIQSVSAGSPLGEDVVFTADTKVTQEEWEAWTEQITKITLKYPDGTSKDLTSDQYRIDNENKNITLVKELFNTTGSHSLTIEADGYAARTTSRTMKGVTPKITMAAGYPMYEDIVLTFNDPTQAYQKDITAKIDGKTVSTTYLDRSEPGKLTIKANYFATGALNEPGEYTLVLSNRNYLPNDQTLKLVLTSETAGKAPEFQDGVYLLADADDLLWFAKQVNVKGIKDIKGRLKGSIDLKNALWTPIGISSTIVFSGVFDGNGYQIIGLNVNSEDNYQGLFGYVNDAVIKNLTVSGQVIGKGWVGGIVGQAANSTIDNCVNKATVQGTVNSGGIAGFAFWASVIQNCSNKGSISGTQHYTGGICAQTAGTTVVQYCINYGDIHGKERVGGITGGNTGSKNGISVDQCVNTGNVSATDNNVGGISGYVQKTVSNCYNTGTVLGEKNDNATGIGGIAGYLSQDRVTNCYNIGSVSCSVNAPITRIGSVVGFWTTNYSSKGNYYLENELISGIGFCTFPDRAPDETESKTADELKALAPTLGDSYVADTYMINSGYPVLAWQSAIAKANQEAADAVIRLINAIGKVDDSDACRDRIAAARWAYNRLTEDQQLLVANEDVLVAAEVAYAQAVGFVEAKTAAKNELESYKCRNDYREAQQAELAAAITAGKSAIDAAADIAGVNSALATAKAAIDKIKTDAQLTAEELATAKEAAKDELDNYKDPNDYREAQQAELAAAIAAGKSAIDAAADIEGVNSALAAAKAAIDEIKTDTQLVNEKRLAGDDRYETAVKVSQAGWTTAGTVILARGDDFADAVAGVPLAHQLNAPILLTQTNSIVPAIIEEITRLKAERVIILGGPGAISDNVRGEFERIGLTVERIEGADRYETAVRIAERMVREGAEFDTAFIAVGTNFADALAASSYAAMRGQPILLTDTNYLPQATKDAIANLGIKNTVVCGGPGAVSESVFDELPNPKRVYGNDRYLTALELAKEFMPKSTKHVYIATGLDFPDAVAGGVLAAKNNSGVLLVQGNQTVPIQQIQDFYVEHGFTGATMFGGSSVVSSELEQWFKDNSQ